ncbi:MAG: Phenylacetic acid catabolic protein [Gemmatimonadales bacterium]
MSDHALRDLLIACADTKLLLGYHYGEWTFGTPELEAAVASCSLSQAEMGHVRLLHAILKKQWDCDPDALVETRDRAEFANIAFLDRPLADWADFVAMNVVVDLAVTRVLHSLRESTVQAIQVNVAKMLDEERYHAHHGRGWFRTMAADPAQRDRLSAATARALASARVWFGPDHADLAAALKADIDGISPAGVAVRELPAPDFAKWNPVTRRIGGGAPEEEILYHLRGTRNAIFKLN